MKPGPAWSNSGRRRQNIPDDEPELDLVLALMRRHPELRCDPVTKDPFLILKVWHCGALLRSPLPVS